MRAVHLRTEYLENPMGLDIRTPRFYWNAEGEAMQTAYQIQCFCKSTLIWDSGKVVSPSMTHIEYGGEPLHSRDRIEWKIRLWDGQDHPGDWSAAFFEMGLLEGGDWKAKWITGNYKPRKNVRYPVDLFRKTISLKKKVAEARLYITALGVYKVYLDGQDITEFELAPGSTDYRKRLQYQIIDMTEILQKVRNPHEIELVIALGDGWYRGSVGAWGFTSVFGRETAVLAQMELAYIDKTRDVIFTDESFAWSNEGAIRFADLKDGERVDFNRRPTTWKQAKRTEKKIIPTAVNNVIPKKKKVFAGKKFLTPSGETVYDFGQNLAGFLRVRCRGEKGQFLTFLMGETLDEEGNFTQKNFQLFRPKKEVGLLGEIMIVSGNAGKLKGQMEPTPEQKVELILSGGEDFYETSFAVFGFRYAKLVCAGMPVGMEVSAVAVYSDMEQVGDFSCANDKVNQLYKNTLWSMRGNFLDVPTDCPTRERLGWTGDAQVFFNTGAYLYDVAAFYRKWLRDMEDNQKRDGKISAVIPYSAATVMYDTTGCSVGWGDAAILVPYRFFQRYGDRRLLEQCYPMMRKYAEFMIRNAGHKDKKDAKANPYNQYVYEKGFHLGEWLEPEEFKDQIGIDTKTMRRTYPEECTAYMSYSMGCMADAARIMGKTEDAARYQEYSDGAKEAYRYLFLREIPDMDRQAKLVRPLAFGLCDDTERGALTKRLLSAMENRNYRIATGFLSTPFILFVLSRAGETETAYRMLLNEEKPGWLYEVCQGATTIWESWEGTDSMNHYSLGAVCEWLFAEAAGIQVDAENHFLIEPHPSRQIGNMRASYRSLYGEVEAAYQYEGEQIKLEIRIPGNTMADFRFRDRIRKLTPGTWQFIF